MNGISEHLGRSGQNTVENTVDTVVNTVVSTVNTATTEVMMKVMETMPGNSTSMLLKSLPGKLLTMTPNVDLLVKRPRLLKARAREA